MFLVTSRVRAEIRSVLSSCKRVSDEYAKSQNASLGFEYSFLIFFDNAFVKNSLQEPIRSIAVLPFINLSDDSELDFLCDGLADDISIVLTHVGNLRVPARTSSFSFKGKDVDIREIGKQLDVETVFEGSIGLYQLITLYDRKIIAFVPCDKGATFRFMNSSG